MGAEKELETMSFDDADKFLGYVRLANLYQNFLRASELSENQRFVVRFLIIPIGCMFCCEVLVFY